MSDLLPTVLALHGQPGSARDFTAVARALGEGRRLLAPDRPGWGERAAEPAAGFAAGAADALAVLDREGVERAVVLGFSWGGGVALELARRHPDRVGALVLAASIGPGEPTAVDRFLALPMVGRAFCATGLSATRMVVRQLVPRLSPRGRAAVTGLVGAGMEGMEPEDLRFFADSCLHRSAVTAFMVEQRALVTEFPAVVSGLGSLRVPTAVVTGDRDRLIHPESAPRLTSEIPDAALVTVPGAGHFLPGAAPDVLASTITATARRATLPGW